jgi:D-glycero-D-manno-heptose 1,7-bisphosphate phosphatase
MLHLAVFLDRDGVINRSRVVDGSPRPPASLAELEILPGVAQACDMLRCAGFRLIVVTNQPDIARGRQTRAVVDEINDALHRALRFDDVLVCAHDDRDDCQCRKPRPGMLLTAAAAHRIDLRRSVMVGDRDRDIEAGRRAGCLTVFIDQHYDMLPRPSADFTAESLLEATDWIIAQTGTTRRPAS